MEHELFQSTLKPSVDTTLLPETIRSSSLGGYPHRAAAMELIFQRSIQERRGRPVMKAKPTLRSDPTPQPEKSNGAQNTSIAQTQSPTPIPAPEPPSLPNTTTSVFEMVTSAIAKHEGSPDPPTPPKPTKKGKKVVQRVELPADAKTTPSPAEYMVQLACGRCGVKQSRSHLQSVYCSFCVGPMSIMKCAGCGTMRVTDVEVCTHCRGRFK